MPKQTIRAPYNQGAADKLSDRLFRKQILKFGEIDYHGRPIRFDKSYADDVVLAFRDSAFDTVPFVLADADNKHTRDPERSRGEVVDLQATDTGLDAIVRLSPSAARIVEENPKFGVSVSIREQFQRADGKSYARALAHVLGTFEPMLPGMDPWQTVNASRQDDEEVIDLTTIDLAKAEKKEKRMGKFTEEQQEEMFSRLAELLQAMDTQGSEEPDEEVDENDEDAAAEDEETLTEEEIEYLRQFLAEVDAPKVEPVKKEVVNASQTYDPHTVELSRQLEAQKVEIEKLRKENSARAFVSERDHIISTHGIPPHIVDMARPLLDNSVELSQGTTAGDVVRNIFKAVGDQVRMLDLSGELGNNFALDASDEDDGDKARLDKIKTVRRQMNI